MSIEKWHRHYGVYGICFRDDSLLVVNKTVGPYKNRYDLPGGTMEHNETLEQTLAREFREETGLQIVEYIHLGFSEFIVRYCLRDNSHFQHISFYFEVECHNHQNVLEFSSDTSGCEWILLKDINEDNSSPLVMKAKNFIHKKEFTYESKKIDDWITIKVD